MVGAHEHGRRGRWQGLHNHTVLARIGPWVVATYGPVMALAFALGFGAAAWYDVATGQDPAGKLAYYLFLVLPAILLGCRAASLLLDWPQLLRHPLRTLLKPGYMLQGGIFGAIAALVVMAWWTGTDLLLIMDSGAFAMPFAEALGRIGCHVYGCCWGRPTKAGFGVRYVHDESKVVRCAPHLRGVLLHPSALYATVAYGLVFIGFCWLLPSRPFDGAIAGLYLCIHPPLRLLLERFRDDDRGSLGQSGLTHTNIYSLIMFGLGLAVMAVGWTRAAGGDPDALSLSLSLSSSLFTGPQHLVAPWSSTWQALVASHVAWWLSAIGAVAFAAFGVHYKKVGTWLGSHDASKARAPGLEGRSQRDCGRIPGSLTREFRAQRGSLGRSESARPPSVAQPCDLWPIWVECYDSPLKPGC